MIRLKGYIIKISDILYTVTLIALGAMTLENNTFHMPLYRFVVTVFIVCGIIKYEKIGFSKALFKNIFKESFMSLLSILIVTKIRKTVDFSEISSFTAILIHNVVLIIIFWLISISEKKCGRVAYITTPLIYVIAYILIILGKNVLCSLIVGTVISQLINWKFAIKKGNKTH